MNISSFQNRQVKKESKCPICGSGNTYLLYNRPIDYDYGSRHSFNLYKCIDCAIIFIQPFPKPEEVLNMYPKNYYSFNFNNSGRGVTSFFYKRYISKEINLINRLCNGRGRVLDVGCGSGYYLFMLRKLNKLLELYGVDIKLTDEAMNVEDIKFYNIDLLDTRFQNNFFDVIAMNHLIEHVINPQELIVRSFDLLKPGGFLLGETPNSSSYSHRLWGSFWGPLHSPRHLIIFNKENLIRMLGKIGFREIKIFHTVRPAGWAKSMKNVLIKNRIMKPIDHKSRLYPLLMLLSSGFIFTEYLFNNSSIIKFLARK